MAVCCASAIASANPQAEQLFRDGRALLKRHELDRACELFQRSQEIEPAVTTLLNLGDCHEQAGRTASAWDAFTRARALSIETSDKRRAAEAERRAAALEPQLARLSLTVPTTVPSGFVVKRCGHPVEAAAWNVAVPVDPGTCTVEASAPGRLVWTASVDAAAGRTTTLVVAIPAADPKAKPAPKPMVELGPRAPRALGVLLGAGERENVLVGARFLQVIPMPGGQVRVIGSAHVTNYVDASPRDAMNEPVDLHTLSVQLGVGAEYLYFPNSRFGLGGGLGVGVDLDFPRDDAARAMFPSEAGGSDVGGWGMVRLTPVVLRLSSALETSFELQFVRGGDELVISGIATLDWFL